MMKALWLASGLVLGAALGAVPSVAADHSSTTPPSAARESPFACDRQALDAKERKRHFEELGPKLRTLRRSTRELGDGYAFEFPADAATVRLLTEWMLQEHACCPFFDLSLTLDREGGAAWLALCGRPGVKEFVRAEFPAGWFSPKR